MLCLFEIAISYTRTLINNQLSRSEMATGIAVEAKIGLK